MEVGAVTAAEESHDESLFERGGPASEECSPNGAHCRGTSEACYVGAPSACRCQTAEEDVHGERAARALWTAMDAPSAACPSGIHNAHHAECPTRHPATSTLSLPPSSPPHEPQVPVRTTTMQDVSAALYPAHRFLSWQRARSPAPRLSLSALPADLLLEITSYFSTLSDVLRLSLVVGLPLLYLASLASRR